MGKIAEAYVEVSSKTQAFDKGLDSSKEKLTGWIASAGKLVAAFAIAKVGQDFLSFMNSAVQSASDLAESANKAGVAFGDSFPKIAKFADAMAESFGIVKKEIFDLTAGLGFMLTNAKLTKDVAADLAIALAKSATDVSSIQNMPVAEILGKMRAGIAGEAEPLRPLGVNISEENVQKKAPSLGFDPAKLNDQQKILTRISLIVEGLSYAEGDLSKTALEYANATRKAAGDWENAKAVIGNEVKPLLTDALAIVYSMGDAFTEAFGTTPLEAFTAYLKQAVIDVKAVRDAAQEFAQYAAAGAKALVGSGPRETSDSIHSRLRAAAVKDRTASEAQTAKQMADAAVKKTRTNIGIEQYTKNMNTPAGAAANNFVDAMGTLKRSLANAGAGNVLAGFLNGGIGGAVKGAAEVGLLNPIARKLSGQAQVGTISNHIMGGSDFASFAQEQVSTSQNAQIEAAKEAAKNTAETVAQVKEVVAAVKNLGSGLKGGAILRGGN